MQAEMQKSSGGRGLLPGQSQQTGQRMPDTYVVLKCSLGYCQQEAVDAGVVAKPPGPRQGDDFGILKGTKASDARCFSWLLVASRCFCGPVLWACHDEPDHAVCTHTDVLLRKPLHSQEERQGPYESLVPGHVLLPLTQVWISPPPAAFHAEASAGLETIRYGGTGEAYNSKS